MHNFNYEQADNIDTALELHSATQNAAFVAGGTNLLDLMKENVAKPDLLTDINKIDGLKLIAETGHGIRLGALATNAQTAYNKLIEEKYPLLSKAILAGASAQLRNMATNGGNLMQRTRCLYFYDTSTPCNKREPGTGCSAIGGVNRTNAILGTSEHCIAVHPSDMCVALAVLDASVHVRNKTGERVIAFEDFHRLPGTTPELDNNLKHDELITAIEIPENKFQRHFSYLKLRDRQSYAFALVSVATALEIEGDEIIVARIALGGVAHKPWRSREAEMFLTGKTAMVENFSEVADMILHGAKGYGGNDFKIELAKRAIIRNCISAAKGTNE